MTKKPKANGFSLIELMVVIGIIGVLLLLVLPNFIGIQKRERTRAAAMEVAQDLRQIRERALAQSGNYTVTFDNIAQPRIYTVTRPDGGVRTYRLGGTTGGNIWFGAGGAFGGNPPEGSVVCPGNNGIDAPLRTIVFDSRGGTTQSVIYVTDGSRNYAVGTNPIGKIKVYHYASGGWY